MRRLAEILCERGAPTIRSLLACDHEACVWRTMAEHARNALPSESRDHFAAVIARVFGRPLTEEEWSALDREMVLYIDEQLAHVTGALH